MTEKKTHDYQDKNKKYLPVKLKLDFYHLSPIQFRNIRLKMIDHGGRSMLHTVCSIPQISCHLMNY